MSSPARRCRRGGDTTRRRAARTVLDILFHRLTLWLAPILVFTMEEVWLERFGAEDSSVHLQDFPETPKTWLDPELAAKWAKVRSARRVVTAALEVERTNKVIGASLEAAPVVFVDDADQLAVLKGVHFDDICITSQISVSREAAPADAFTLPEVSGVAVVFEKADGEKCTRCWKVLPDVGTHAHPEVCARCDDAVS